MATSPNFHNLARPVAMKAKLVVGLIEGEPAEVRDAAADCGDYAGPTSPMSGGCVASAPCERLEARPICRPLRGLGWFGRFRACWRWL